MGACTVENIMCASEKGEVVGSVGLSTHQLVLELLQLAQLLLVGRVEGLDHGVQAQVVHRRLDGLSRLGAQAHDAKARGVDLLRKLNTDAASRQAEGPRKGETRAKI